MEVAELKRLYQTVKDVEPPKYVICNGELLYFEREKTTYKQYLSVIDILRSEKPELEKLSGVLGVYFGEDEYTAYDSEGIDTFFLSVMAYVYYYQIRELQELKPAPKNEKQHKAEMYAVENVGDISNMGLWLTVDSLSQRQRISHDEVMELRYSTVFNILKLETYNSWVEYHKFKPLAK